MLFANCLQIILFAIWSLCGHNCIEWPLLAYVIYLCLLELVGFLYAMFHRECERDSAVSNVLRTKRCNLRDPVISPNQFIFTRNLNEYFS